MQTTLIAMPEERFNQYESELNEIKSLLLEKDKSKNLNKWLDKKEASKMLLISSRTLDNYLKKGVLPYSQFKNKIYIKSSDIELHLNKYYIKAKS